MIASTSNIASQATLTVSPVSAEQDIHSVTDGDYSSSFSQSMDGETIITMTFENPTDIGYIAIGGSNISQKDNLKILVTGNFDDYLFSSDGYQIVSSDGYYIGFNDEASVDDSSLGMRESNVMMYKVDAKGATEVVITITGTGTLIVSEIAVGDYYEIPRGQQAGYKMPWTVPNIKGRSATNLDNAPINLSYESRSIKATLTVPKNIMVDFDGWYDFIYFASSNVFYILEDDNKFHSYACFNGVASESAGDSATRKLASSSITFNAFAKTIEGLF